jgi:hypothetical protein
MASMRPKTRALMAGQSTASTDARMPRAAPSRVWAATSATCTSIFVGMQPALRHVPPKCSPSSTRSTRWSAKRSSAIELPDPAPTITRS